MPPDQPLEQEIQFKKRARRRLVGAIALVLLMVTILPMVLDDRAVKSPSQEIAITIPSQDGTEFSSKVVPVGPTVPEPAVSSLEPQPGKASAEEAVPTKKAEPEKSPEKSADKPAHAVTPKSEAQKPLSGTAAGGGAYTVQIGVFSDSANVKKLQQKLQTLGYKSYTEMIDTPKGEKIRLRTGPFDSRELADNALTTIKGAGLSGLVVLNK